MDLPPGEGRRPGSGELRAGVKLPVGRRAKRPRESSESLGVGAALGNGIRVTQEAWRTACGLSVVENRFLSCSETPNSIHD